MDWQQAAYSWGVSIGRSRFLDGEPVGDSKGCGLNKDNRQAFDKGLRRGYDLAKFEHENNGAHPDEV